MKALGRYTLTAVTIVLVSVAALWAFVGEAGRTSLLVAAAIALPVQILTFGLLVRSSIDSAQFMLWWGIGVLGRMLVVVALGLALDAFAALDPTVLIMSVCGFFFALLLLEPAFFTRRNSPTRFAQ